MSRASALRSSSIPPWICGVALQAPAFAWARQAGLSSSQERDLCALRAGRGRAGRELDVREARVVAKRYGYIAVPIECSFHHDLWLQALSEPSQEGSPASGDRGWRHPSAVYGGLHAQCGRARLYEWCIAR